MQLKGWKGKRNICGPKIREERNKRGDTQTQLCEELQDYGVDLNQKLLSNIELQKRHVTDYEFAALIRVLQVEPLDLLPLD